MTITAVDGTGEVVATTDLIAEVTGTDADTTTETGITTGTMTMTMTMIMTIIPVTAAS
jgi:hypothetical protein